jgi:DNA polymerase IV
MTKKIIHIDMDCFYAAVEMRDNPALVGKPIAVGGDAGKRGVLCTSNYMARQFGVRSAMATGLAYKLCPKLIVIKPHMDKYKKIAHAIRALFFEYTDLVEPLSLDEAYLDVSESKQCFGSATLIAQEIRQKIERQHQLTASAGIAPNKFLAKIASDWNKPNGQFVIPPDAVAPFVQTLPVDKIFGVGKVTAKKLHQYGLQTCSDLNAFGELKLLQHFGKFGQHLFRLSQGIDHRPVDPHRERKSVSVEHTFAQDLMSLDDCLSKVEAMFAELLARVSDEQSTRLHKQFVKVKFCDFEQTTVECVMPAEVSRELFCSLLQKAHQRQGKPVRLIGLGVSFKAKVMEVQRCLF